jgi:predicted nucleic acid-binding protein
MIVVDTSVLVDALTGSQSAREALRNVIASGHRIVVPTLVLYEWLRGPRLSQELQAQEALFPRASALPFGAEESAVAAHLYGQVKRPRGREIDLAVAAHAVVAGASLWTLNRPDFDDVPGLLLW